MIKNALTIIGMFVATLFLCGASLPSDVYDVNEYVNSFKYISEKEDYWKSPEEFYADGGGDCEDFSIAKYHLLKDKYDVVLLLGVVKSSGIYHAVLMVDNKWILENGRNYVYEKSFLAGHMTIEYASDDKGYLLCNESFKDTCTNLKKHMDENPNKIIRINTGKK